MRILSILALLTAVLFAESIVMKSGESRIYEASGNVTSVSASNSKVLNYAIISNNKVMIYAKEPGFGDVEIFGNGGRMLQTYSVTVDSQKAQTKELEALIQSKIEGSNIKLEKMAIPGKEGYIISGSVPDEGSRDLAFNMAAVGLGLTKRIEPVRRQTGDATSTQGAGGGGAAAGAGGVINLDFLARLKVDDLVDRLIIPPSRQVNIKVIVADVEKIIADRLGVDINGGQLTIPILGQQQGQINIQAVVDMLKDEQIARILARPNLSVISGESANFQVTSQFTPITNTVTVTGQPVASPGTPVDYGVSLTIQPKVYSKDRIVVSIAQEVSNIQSLVEKNGASAANIKKRKAQSVIELHDGASFILGGLLDERDVENVKSVPFLGDIPVLGSIFRKPNLQRTKNELIIIVTVSLVNPITDDYIYIPQAAVRGLGSSFLNIPDYNEGSLARKDIDAFVSNVGFIK
ncbi:hypothetical protein BKH43_00260 [Helicobacter sp. 13S00401-1]|uniref:type II and III secretion system protein family protein n=1 Tax=Helicobacter sp. 13S00401-1 TaxID=1905758 RepID=UPI000BD9F0E8|nr:pilus assembly protein N-terminal domain-containing protein [Helicobacter sp. 13S00401-1]PAF51710.1 hypothetical protein BKH43_00260 [Helicobacter sp. 13S00401-1]